MKIRKDNKFTRLPQWKIDNIREWKLRGYSLREISKYYGVAKSTASLYCRDLFFNPMRKYQSESEIREAIALKGKGTDHAKYHQCVDCGETIRNTNKRCLACLITYQSLNGDREKWIESGKPTRIINGKEFAEIRWGKHDETKASKIGNVS
jgi:hypothetical protein